MKDLQITSQNGYLNLIDLPHNCIFNKVITGCGGTTIALINDEDYIIAVPTTELIINKTGRDKSGYTTFTHNGKSQLVYGLFGSMKESIPSLKEYLSKPGTKKIMCTYDKLPRLMEYIEPLTYRLLVDEYHSLLKAYAYRSKAIDGIWQNFRSFKSYCFMSATPLTTDFSPCFLSDIETVVAKWDNVDKLKIQLERTNKPYQKVLNYISAYKRDGYIVVNDHKSYEAFFFINSVKDIGNILDKAGLSNEEVKIVCADNEENSEKLFGYTISNSLAPNKMFNFITSKSFEGADYFSDTGLCFVVSSSTNPHTQASIDTDIPQIANRIRTRTNPFRNTLIHICNSNITQLDTTYDEKKTDIDKRIADSQDILTSFNSNPEHIREALKKRITESMNKLYLIFNESEKVFELNDTLPKLELYNFNVNQLIYKDGISIAKAYEESGHSIETNSFEFLESYKIGRKISFKDAFLRYIKSENDAEKKELAYQQPLIIEASKILGADRVKELRYIKKDIQEVIKNHNENQLIASRIKDIIAKDI